MKSTIRSVFTQVSRTMETVVIFSGLDGGVQLSEPFSEGNWGKRPTQRIPIPAQGPQDYESLAQALIPKLPAGNLILIGESFSSPLVLKLANRLRERTTAMVLLAGFCASPAPSALALFPLRPLFLVKPPRRLIRRFLLSQEASTEQTLPVIQAIRACPAATLSQRLQVILTLSEKDCPAPKNLPILILQARHDALLPWESQSRLERHLPHATVTWIDGPHLLAYTQPAACRDAIRAFLDSEN